MGVSAFFLCVNLLSGIGELGSGRSWLAATALATAAAISAALLAVWLRPMWFARILNVLFLFLTLMLPVETLLLGGIEQSSARILWGLMTVLGALVALNVRAAFGWFVGFSAAVIAAAMLPEWIEPRYVAEGSTGERVANIIGVTTLAFATMAYFVRQRDRFQRQSDDLLHSILPEEIARRLKAGSAMIADHFESASVLFADVVGFTPMSATMTPAELVSLLNDVFSTFDGFVVDLGLEKIKTVGDEYMVAAGVPVAMSDHAHRVAELALRIREHVDANDFDGHKIALRIGINSGPVVAGIIGTRKFAYDLWGDTVNTASRMESAGLAGSIQLSAVTRELIRDSFVCEPRGIVSVKGKGDMPTYLLVSRRADAPVTG